MSLNSGALWLTERAVNGGGAVTRGPDDVGY